jgi:hypothetical protein
LLTSLGEYKEVDVLPETAKYGDIIILKELIEQDKYTTIPYIYSDKWLPLVDKISADRIFFTKDIGNLDTKGLSLEDILINLSESEATGAYPIKPGVTTLEPNVYYTFGEVDNLHLNLNETENSSVIEEFCFEFIPSLNFSSVGDLQISPPVRWVNKFGMIPGDTY